MPKGYEISRRSLLTGIALASAAMAMPMQAEAAQVATENPALLAKVSTLSAVAIEATAANADLAACIAEWSPRWPSVPDAIKINRPVWREDEEAHLFDGSPALGNDDRPLAVLTTAALDSDIAAIAKAMRRARPAGKPFRVLYRDLRTADEWAVELEQLRDLRAIASKYEAAQARIVKVSCIDGRRARRTAAQATLADAVSDIMSERPETADGLIIQAQALQAWGQADPWAKAMHALSSDWSHRFATSLLRIASPL